MDEEENPFTCPAPSAMEMYDQLRRRRREGMYARLTPSAPEARFPLPEHVEMDWDGHERDMAMMRWLRDWRWSQQFLPPQPLVIVTGI
jgi:hypothetical protein